MSQGIDLSQLPAPLVVEPLEFETILSELKSAVISLMTVEDRDGFQETLNLESEPVTKLLEVAAYRELLVRQRINDSARSIMLAFAVGSDLDQIGANFNVTRLTVSPAKPDATPPREAVMESDADFRARIQISPEGYTTAGSIGSYRFHSLSAHPDVKDVHCVSLSEGEVSVYVLSRQGNGFPTSSLINAVTDALNADEVRPLTDKVSVLPANIHNYAIEATLYVPPGPDREVVRSRAAAALELLITKHRKIGDRVSIGSIYAALQQPGVDYVELTSPNSDIIADSTTAPFCTGYQIAMEYAG